MPPVFFLNLPIRSHWPQNVFILLIERIQRHFAIRALGKVLRASPRRPKVINLKQARMIGILYLMENAEDLAEVESFASRLRISGKKVVILGFHPGKKLPVYFTPTGQNECLTRKDLNWNQIPGSASAGGFLQNAFDLLIDLSPAACLPMKYIAALTDAAFRVGEHHSDSIPVFDLLIRRDADKPLQHFILQLEHYLEILNPS